MSRRNLCRLEPCLLLLRADRRGRRARSVCAAHTAHVLCSESARALRQSRSYAAAAVRDRPHALALWAARTRTRVLAPVAPRSCPCRVTTRFPLPVHTTGGAGKLPNPYVPPSRPCTHGAALCAAYRLIGMDAFPTLTNSMCQSGHGVRALSTNGPLCVRAQTSVRHYGSAVSARPALKIFESPRRPASLASFRSQLSTVSIHVHCASRAPKARAAKRFALLIN